MVPANTAFERHGTATKRIVRVWLPVLVLVLFACGDESGNGQQTDASLCPIPCLPDEVCNPDTLMCERESTDQGLDVADMEDTLQEVDEADLGRDIVDLHEPVEDLPDIEDEDLAPIDTSEPDTSDLQGEPEIPTDVPYEEEGPPEPVPPVTAMHLELNLPEGVIVRWTLPDTEVSGYRVERDGELVSELEFPTLDARSVTGLTPGETYEFSVQAFITTPQGRRYSDLSVESIEIPIPEAMLVTPLTDLVMGSSSLGGGQMEFLYVALYYGSSSENPWAELYDMGVKRASAVVTFTSSNDSAASVTSAGVILSDAEGSTTVSAVYTWTGGEIKESIDVEVYDGVKKGNLLLSLEVPEPEEGDGEEEPELPVFSVQVLGPNDLAPFNFEPGVELNIPLYAGTHQLFVEDENGILRRQVVHIVPSRQTRVVIPWLGVPACELIDDDIGGAVTAANGALFTIPAGALESDTEICVTAMVPAEGPRRGPSDTYPLTAPETYEITPANLELLEPATLAMPIASDLADFMEIEFDPSMTVLPVYRFDRVQWVAAAVGTMGTAGAQDFINVDITQLGTYSAQLCQGVGSNEDACRVRYGSCDGGTISEVPDTEVVGESCGDIVDSIVEDHNFTTTDITEIDGPIFTDLGGVASRAFGLHGDFVDTISCVANPCGSGETCSAQCRATTTVLSCGRSYTGSVERHDGVTGWGLVRELEIIVPVYGSCGEYYEACGDIECLPDIEVCIATCLVGE